MSLGRACALIAVAATPALAETIRFEADDSILIVRGRQSGTIARLEFLAEGDGRIQCVALDAAGKPLAVETTFADLGVILFDDLSVADVANVVCQPRE